MIHLHSLGNKAMLSTLMLLAFGIGSAQAQEQFSPEKLKEARQWVQDAKDNFANSSSARFQKAVSALTKAAASEKDAMDLYLKAQENRFTNNSGSSSMMGRAFGGFGMNRGGMGGPGGSRGGMGGMGGPGGSRGGMGGGRNSSSSSNKAATPKQQYNEWYKQFRENSGGPDFKRALQLQLKWMLLTLKASNAEKTETEIDLSSDITGLLSQLAGNVKDLAPQMNSVGSASSVIREYLGINDYRSQNMPDNMMDINAIYERVLLVSAKENKDISKFRSLWNQRIKMEWLITEANSSIDKKSLEEEKKNFYAQRKWEMEKACFELGDQVTAFNNLKTLLSHIKSPSERQSSIKELEYMLLSP